MNSPVSNDRPVLIDRPVTTDVVTRINLELIELERIKTRIIRLRM